MFFYSFVSATRFSGIVKLKVLTPRDKADIREFEEVTESEMQEVDRYVSGEWEWHELWDYNFKIVNVSGVVCKCRFEGIRASGRRKGYPRSIRDLESLGFKFTLIKGGKSWYVDGYYRCGCGQIWKEEFVEAMQYNGNHAYAISNFEEDC